MPRPTIHQTLDEAVSGLRDGMTVMVGGFGAGHPHNLLTALWRSGVADLTIVANGLGYASPDPDVKWVAELVTDGRVRKVIASFTATTRPSRAGQAQQLIAEGRVQAELVAQGTLAERIRAAGAGIPAFYTPAGAGTLLAEGKEVRRFDGRDYLLEHALPADVALIRAHKADTAGNLVFRRAARNFNPLMAMAADLTIVEVEEPIVPAGEIDPDQVHTPGIYVHRMVQIPPGGMVHLNRVTGLVVRQPERVPVEAAE